MLTPARGGDLAAPQTRHAALADLGQSDVGRVSLARLVARNSRTSARLSMPTTVRRRGRAAPGVPCRYTSRARLPRRADQVPWRARRPTMTAGRERTR